MDLDNLCIGIWVDVECRFFNICIFMIVKFKVFSIKIFIFKNLNYYYNCNFVNFVICR